MPWRPRLQANARRSGGYCYWRTPFAKKAQFEASCDGAGEARLEVEITLAPAEWTEQTSYFHAKRRREAPNVTFDWRYLECEGRGRFSRAARLEALEGVARSVDAASEEGQG